MLAVSMVAVTLVVVALIPASFIVAMIVIAMIVASTALVFPVALNPNRIMSRTNGNNLDPNLRGRTALYVHFAVDNRRFLVHDNDSLPLHRRCLAFDNDDSFAWRLGPPLNDRYAFRMLFLSQQAARRRQRDCG
jgi:hypothetical protein